MYLGGHVTKTLGTTLSKRILKINVLLPIDPARLWTRKCKTIFSRVKFHVQDSVSPLKPHQDACAHHQT